MFNFGPGRMFVSPLFFPYTCNIYHSGAWFLDFVSLFGLATCVLLLDTILMDVHNKITRSYNMSRIKGGNHQTRE